MKQCYLIALLPLLGSVGIVFSAPQAPNSCVFQKKVSSVGDLSRQLIQCNLGLEMRVMQGDATVSTTQQHIRRQQKRQIEVVEVDQNVPTKAIVSFMESTVSLQHADQEATESAQPVSGKSYIVTRRGLELQITDMKGQRPPEEELAITRANLETFGLPNPIASFFHNREMTVGEEVKLPIELAKELLGFQDTVGNVSALKMKLVALRDIRNTKTAVFETTLIAKNSDTSGLSIELKGQMAIEIDTCRTIAINLTGPVSVSENHTSKGGSFQVSSKGSLKVGVRASYGKSGRVASRKSKTTKVK